MPNKATRDARETARLLVEAPAYRAGLARRLRSGDLAPAVECMLWAYAYGRPPQHLTLEPDPADGPIVIVDRIGEGYDD